MAVVGVVEELEPMASELISLQFRLGVDQPVNLNPVLSGLVESWASGCDWAELCGSTSLDQGDLCRIIRRTTEVLRSMCMLTSLPEEVRDTARAAINEMDRMPVSDTFAGMAEALSKTKIENPLGEAEGEDEEGEDEKGKEEDDEGDDLSFAVFDAAEDEAENGALGGDLSALPDAGTEVLFSGSAPVSDWLEEEARGDV